MCVFLLVSNVVENEHGTNSHMQRNLEQSSVD